jgi:hypothetical protein
VKFSNTESVHTTKDKNSRGFHNIDARSLVLWKVSIPVDRDLQGHLAHLGLTNKSQLSSVDDLLDVFPDLPIHKHLHIMGR